MEEGGLTHILYNIINVQSFQIHQFRNYLGGHGGYNTVQVDGEALTAESVGHHCESDGTTSAISASAYTPTAAKDVADCTPSATNICMSVNVFTGETGYYELEGHDGPSPEITVKIGETITFDQSDPSNWYHPVGFAYKPDGAHGATWGGEELPEVEGAGELQYKIDGANPDCADAGDTGLDCYEPEFFFPREEWMSKKYTAELTVTQAVADASHGGVIYYFCHIHSKMSGKIRILNADGTAFTPTASGTELDLYSVHDVTPVDGVCGTSGLEPYSFGQEHACAERYICGDLDTDFEKCLDAMNCEMKTNMHSYTTADHSNKVAVFMQQMIPHHKNAINMAKLLLRQVPAEDITSAMDEDKLTNILYDIISVQSFQVHQFRNYLGPHGLCHPMATIAMVPLTAFQVQRIFVCR
jgi:plastocyanin